MYAKVFPALQKEVVSCPRKERTARAEFFEPEKVIHTIFKMAFQMACEDNAIVRNSCSFSLKSVIDDDTPKVNALSREQEESLFRFLRTDTYGQRHLNMFTLLIGTGTRISEYAALAIKDIDFTSNVIHVNKQSSDW